MAKAVKLYWPDVSLHFVFCDQRIKKTSLLVRNMAVDLIFEFFHLFYFFYFLSFFFFFLFFKSDHITAVPKNTSVCFQVLSGLDPPLRTGRSIVPVCVCMWLSGELGTVHGTSPTGPNEWQWSAAVRWSIAVHTKQLPMTDICPHTLSPTAPHVLKRWIDR